jgi:diguanylate cyclase (GGDEF)-like protein
MAGRPSGSPKKRAVPGRATPLGASSRPREKEAPRKPGTPKRSAAMQLAAEVDRLKADLAAARARVAELETRVDEDPLTGLRNRHGFERALEQALAYVRRYKTPAALVYVDLDRFKPINDRHGHAAGDAVLTSLARTARGVLRDSDMAGRLGGEEFGLLLPHADDALARGIAERLRQAIAAVAAPLPGGGELHFTVSVGAATLEPGDADLAALLARADAAMYQAKRAGRNGVSAAPVRRGQQKAPTA